MTKKPTKRTPIVQIEGDASTAFKAAMLKAAGEQVDKLRPLTEQQVREMFAAKDAAKHKAKDK